MPEPISSSVPLAGTVADHPLDDVVRTLCQQRRNAVGVEGGCMSWLGRIRPSL